MILGNRETKRFISGEQGNRASHLLICFRASANGCCVYDPVDCNEAYTLLHVYNLVRECSGKNQCGPLPAPMNTLSSCGDNGSTYVRIQYDCLSGKHTIGRTGQMSVSAHKIRAQNMNEQYNMELPCGGLFVIKNRE